MDNQISCQKNLIHIYERNLSLLNPSRREGLPDGKQLQRDR